MFNILDMMRNEFPVGHDIESQTKSNLSDKKQKSDTFYSEIEYFVTKFILETQFVPSASLHEIKSVETVRVSTHSSLKSRFSICELICHLLSNVSIASKIYSGGSVVKEMSSSSSLWNQFRLLLRCHCKCYDVTAKLLWWQRSHYFIVDTLSITSLWLS